ncbi:hypothetical protein JOL62DRAFT_266797 [Phyllosticta paracitricarpa]|uniref:Uncharacterized protein n=1 Tax=Phyllosticta paracitricarpa TaxID=2016321 RepID=A0ABR1N0N5_9PEZI
MVMGLLSQSRSKGVIVLVLSHNEKIAETKKKKKKKKKKTATCFSQGPCSQLTLFLFPTIQILVNLCVCCGSTRWQVGKTEKGKSRKDKNCQLDKKGISTPTDDGEGLRSISFGSLIQKKQRGTKRTSTCSVSCANSGNSQFGGFSFYNPNVDYDESSSSNHAIQWVRDYQAVRIQWDWSLTGCPSEHFWVPARTWSFQWHGSLSAILLHTKGKCEERERERERKGGMCSNLDAKIK